MGGPKGGKHSKGKVKTKPKKMETSHKKTESLNSKLDPIQTSNIKDHGLGNSKGKSPKTTTWTMESARCTEDELERFLSAKLEDLYTKIKGCLLTSGYGMTDVERALLNNGHVNGPKNLLNNIMRNTVAFLEEKMEAKEEAFKDMKELYKATLKTLIDSVLHTEPHLQRLDAMWLLVKNWGVVPSTSNPSPLLSGDENMDTITDGSCGGASYGCNERSVPDLSSTVDKVQSELNIESSSEKVGILERINTKPALLSQIKRDIPVFRVSLKKIIGTTFIKQHDIQITGNAPLEGSYVVDSDILTFLEEECVKRWQESSPDDMKTACVVDLIESIRNLLKKLKVQKQWAQKKVTDSAKRLSKDFLELNSLRMEKMETQCMKDEKLCAENSYMLMLKETKESLRNVNRQANIINGSIKTLEVSNAEFKADIKAVRLSESEYGTELNQVLHRETRCMKKLAAIEKQTFNLRANCDEEKQKVLQLQQDDFQAEEEAKGAEVKWRQEIKEKEQMVAVLGEESRMAGAQKANLRAELVRVRGELERERKVKKDEVKRLEDELCRLHMFQQMSNVNVSVEGDTFLFNGVEVASLESSVPYESWRHWNCMTCFTNEVSVVFLPCTHQVMCSSCYEGSCSSSAGGLRCPYCSAQIQQAIKVYGPT